MTIPSMDLRRKAYGELLEWKGRDDRKSLLIRGARQVGKTYLIRKFAEENYRSVIYIDFDADESACSIFEGDLDVDTVMMNISARYPDTRMEPFETVIILDEIQACPRARSALKSFSQDRRYDVIASGSLLGIRLSDVPSMPVGQEERITMHPLDFEEFLWALGVDSKVVDHLRSCIRDRTPIGKGVHESLMRYLNWYMLVGGMPSAVRRFVKERRFDGVRKVQSRIVEDYTDDIAKHCDDSQKIRTELCFRSLSRQLAKDNKRFVTSGIEPDLEYRPSSSRYEYAINWLYSAGIVNECRRVTNPRMPAEESGVPDTDETAGAFKLYMNDTGILTSLYDPAVYPEILRGNIEVNRGALTENLVASMLTAQGRRLLYFEISHEIELDFILVVKGKATAIEVKSGRSRSCRSLNKAMERYGLKGIMLDTLDIHVDDKGVEHFPIYAAAFMDCIDLPVDTSVDFGDVDGLNAMFVRKDAN